MIESIHNEKVKYWSKLNDKKYQDIEGLFLVEGEHLVEEAMAVGLLHEVIVLEGTSFPYENSTYVSEKVMRRISTLTMPPKIIGVVKKKEEKPVRGRILLLDALQDPGNMGTIIRSAVAFNIDTVVVGEGSVSIYNPKVIRASEGMIFHMNILEANLLNTIKTLKSEDYIVFTTSVLDGKVLEDITFPPKVAIVIGNEGKGVKREISALADSRIYIEMNRQCESLNAGVATSIILYELDKHLKK